MFVVYLYLKDSSYVKYELYIKFVWMYEINL